MYTCNLRFQILPKCSVGSGHCHCRWQTLSFTSFLAQSHAPIISPFCIADEDIHCQNVLLILLLNHYYVFYLPTSHTSFLQMQSPGGMTLQAGTVYTMLELSSGKDWESTPIVCQWPEHSSGDWDWYSIVLAFLKDLDAFKIKTKVHFLQSWAPFVIL